MHSDRSVEKTHMKRKGGKLLPALCRIVGILILLLVIGFSLSLLLPRFLGYQVYNIMSGSMEPAIPAGSLIYVKDLEPEDVAEGDVIVFEMDGSVVAHRVVQNRFVEGEFVTKGDANAGEDLFNVRYGDLLGRVTAHVPRLGAFSMLYSTTVGKVYVLLFALCGVLFNILSERLRSNAARRLQESGNASQRDGSQDAPADSEREE